MCQEVSLPTLKAMGCLKSHKRPGEQEVLAEARRKLWRQQRLTQEGLLQSLQNQHQPTCTIFGDCWASGSGSLLLSRLGEQQQGSGAGGTGHSTGDPPEPHRASRCRKSGQHQPLY